MVSLPRHFVPNPVLLHSTRRGVKRPESLFLHTRYDLAGNVLSTTDPDGNETVWTYDALNRVSTETECAGTSSQATASYVYDLDGNVVQSTDYDGRVIQYVYDNMGRERHENWMSGTTTVDSMTFTYDADGRLTGASDPASASETFAYLCPCQLGGMDFFRAAVLFSPGREKRVGGPGGGASSPWSPAGGGRNRHGRFHRWGGVWQDAGRGQTGVPGGLSA